jgi:hypothetical protein
MAIRQITPQRLPVVDYDVAIAHALDWLGERYLLATPVKARTGRGNESGTADDRRTHFPARNRAA